MAAVNFGNSGYGRNIVEYNEIRHACLETADVAAINSNIEDPGDYVEGSAERSGHLIRYNFIADTRGCQVNEERRLVPDPAQTFTIVAVLMGTCIFFSTKKGELPIDGMIEQSDYNLFFNAAGGEYAIEECIGDTEKVLTLADWQKRGFDIHSSPADGTKI